jgi:hypothetical protein
LHQNWLSQWFSDVISSLSICTYSTYWVWIRFSLVMFVFIYNEKACLHACRYRSILYQQNEKVTETLVSKVVIAFCSVWLCSISWLLDYSDNSTDLKVPLLVVSKSTLRISLLYLSLIPKSIKQYLFSISNNFISLIVARSFVKRALLFIKICLVD